MRKLYYVINGNIKTYDYSIAKKYEADGAKVQVDFEEIREHADDDELRNKRLAKLFKKR